MFLFAFLCLVSGAFTAYVVFPFYLRLDLVRQIGMAGLKDLDSGSKVFMQMCLLGGAAYVLFPGFLLARRLEQTWKQLLIPLLVSFLYPWLPTCLMAPLLTNADGMWSRGVVNAIALGSLPLLNWLFVWSAFGALRKKKLLN